MLKRLFLLLPLIFMSCSLAPPINPDAWGLNGSFEKSGVSTQDSLGNTWSLYRSDALGFWEFWVASSDTSNGRDRKPYYTAVPADPNYEHTLSFDNRQLVIKRTQKLNVERNYYQRDLYEPGQEEFVIPLSDLFYDLDADGLTDYAEYVLFTDPYNNDSDNDGKADGFDQNPLAAPNDTLTDAQDLHRYIIERQFELFKTRRLLLVEQFDNIPMEYERENGLVLSLTSQECDEFIDTFGYGVPILTASVKDTLDHFLVNYQLFINPETAFGFDAIYDWSDSWHQWVRIQTLYDWEAAP